MSEDGGEASVVEPLGTVGRYVLRRELASGGMATVYLASLTGPHGFEKVVAVKRIHPHLTKDRRFVEMFLDEARVAALIHHPNVCAIVDFGEEQGTPFLVMEYLQGESLASVLLAGRADGGVPFGLAARVIHDAARGLHAAHELRGADGVPLGVVHRDVSPQNIFVLYDGVTKVVDFGVARARGRLTVTRTNEIKGKLAYMSPEQYDGEHVDRRTDVWALGVVLWETTVGRRLFRGDNDGATIARVLHRPIPLPGDHRPDYPDRLQGIVMKCLERDPERRYATAEELAEELEEFVYATGKPAGASQVKRWMHEHHTEAIARGGALLRGEPLDGLPSEQSGSTLSSIRSHTEPVVGPEDATPIWPRHDAARGRPEKRKRPAPVAGAEGDTVVTRPLHGSASRPAIEPPRDAPRTSRKPALLAVAAAAVVLVASLAIRPRLASHASSSGSAVRSTTPSAAGGANPRGASAPPAPAALDRVEAPAPRPEEREAAPSEAPAPAPAARPEEREAVRPSSLVSVPAPAPAEAAVRSASSRPASSRVPTNARTAAAPRATPHASSASSAAGTLNLLAIPPATVRLGGRSLGETPLVRVALPPGDHRLDLRTSDGRTQSITVHIESGRATRRRVEL